VNEPGSEKKIVSVSVLGELALEVNGRPSSGIVSRRARSLLGWLAVHPGLHPRGRVAGVFWPDVLEKSARSSLRTTLATLKRELGEPASGIVTASRERVGIEPGPQVAIDLSAFEELVAGGELERAVELCRGDLLADLDDDWVNEPRERHRQRLLGVLGELAERAERSGDLEAALERTRAQVTLDPLSESAQRELVRRLAAAGDRSSALAAYEEYSERLRRELGMAPSAASRQLVEQVRRGEAAQHPPENGGGPTVETRYAKSGDLSIAYQAVGKGPDVVFVPGSLSHVELGWETPPMETIFRRLSGFGRMIAFDKRGTGLSDRTAELPTLEERMDDVRAVMDAAGCVKAALVGISEGGPMTLLFAATYPERVRALVLWATFARLTWAPDYPDGVDAEETERGCDLIEEVWGQGLVWPQIAINDAPEDEATRRHLARFERNAATPAMAAAANRFGLRVDARHVLSSISAPTLVVHRSGDPVVPAVHGRYLAEHIRGARLSIFPGDFHESGVGKDEEVLDEIEEFLTGSPQEDAIDRVLKTILFTDADDSVVRRELGHYQGQAVKNTGEGFLASFDGPARAIHCARAIVDDAGANGLQVRAGLHSGECEVHGVDLTGIAVDIGVGVGGLADPGEVLATSTVRDLVTGSGIEFHDRGRHPLDGISGEWQVLAVKG